LVEWFDSAACEATEKQQEYFVPGAIDGDSSVNNNDVVALFRLVSGSGSISDKPYNPDVRAVMMAIIPQRSKASLIK